MSAAPTGPAAPTRRLPPPASGGIREFLGEYGWAYLFILVPLITFGIFVLYPLFWAFFLSFQNWTALNGGEWAGLRNYAMLFNNPIYLKAFKNTVQYTVFTVPVNIGVGLLLATLLYPLKPKVQHAFKFAYYLPVVAAGIVMALVWNWMLDVRDGLVNYMLINWLHVGASKLLSGSASALWTLIFKSYPGGHGGVVVLYLAAMNGIPGSLYEAAELDNTSGWRKFWRITFPLLKPTTVYLLITGVIGAMQTFGEIYVLTQGGPNFSTTTLGFMLYETAFTHYEWGFAAAQGFVLGGIILLITALQYKFLTSDVEY
jgi:multiple sugar transport system permease protein